MGTPETDPAYLAQVIEAIVAAVKEADAILALDDVGEVRELLRHANDLLNIVSDGIFGSLDQLASVDRLRNMIGAMTAAAAERAAPLH